MNPAKEKRNEHIRARFRELRAQGKDSFDAIELIFNSPENKYWCLVHDTIRHIATRKNPSKMDKMGLQTLRKR